MPVTVTMPPVGDAAAEVTIGAWLRRPGEAVAEGEPLLEILSDKVTIEVPAPAGGTLAAIAVPEGETVAIGAAIATIALPGEAAVAAAPAAQAAPAEANGSSRPPVAATPAPQPAMHERPPSPAVRTPPVAGPVEAAAPAPPANGHRLITPRARQLAAEHGLSADELAGIAGGGLGGRLNADDVAAYLARRPPGRGPAVATPAPPLPSPASAPSAGSDDAVLPLTPLRRAIASHMQRSVQTAPHGWMSVEIDMSAVGRARAAMRAAFEAGEGFGLTSLPFFAAAVVGALRATPALNATWAGDALQPAGAVNLGVAVAVEGGLVVPVVAGADGLNLTGLARALRDRVERARANRLTPADMNGGTFTINNTGAVGSILSRPIINQPQVAIVTMEAIVRRPVVVGEEDAIAVRPLMNACLSYDERAVDADRAGHFLADLRQRLEDWTG